VTSRAIVQTMIDLCRNLGMECIFEGVETEAQLETLVNMGARVIQGYLFGRPMTTEALLDYLAHEQRRNERDHRSVTLEAVG